MRPSFFLIILVVLWCVTGFPILFFAEWGLPWALSGAGLIALALTDMILGIRRRRGGSGIELSRSTPNSTTLNVPSVTSIELNRTENLGSGYITLYEDLPPHVVTESYPFRVKASQIPEEGTLQIRGVWKSLKRCHWESSCFRVGHSSPLHLFDLSSFISCPVTCTTYPNLGLDPHSEALQALRLGAGNVPVRQRGEGTDFKELREYRPGDPVRRIDWRATSRRSDPIVRSYQEDRDQQILIVLDGGYRLHQKEGEGLQFEYALSAALNLSRVALEHGDSVGVYAYGAEDRWIPPGKGRSWFWKLVRSLYDFESSPSASSPASALEKVLGRLNRRTLLVVMTNLREEDGEMVEWMLPLVRGRHMMMTVTFREEGATGPAAIESSGDALEYGAATLYREQRILIRRYWEKQGIVTLDARPSEVSGRMINRYLEMKTAGVL